MLCCLTGQLTQNIVAEHHDWFCGPAPQFCYLLLTMFGMDLDSDKSKKY